MSYQLVAAKARAKGLDALWGDVDIASLTLGALYATYANVWMTLSHSAVAGPLYLELNAVRDLTVSQYHNYTIAQWFVALNEATLPTKTYLPNLNLRRVRYADAWHAGYDIKPFDRYRNENAELSLGDKNDLFISKTGINFLEDYRHVLVSVNGFFHRAGGSVRGLEVIDGGLTGRLGNDNQVGVHSFKDVGSLTCYPITSSMVYTTVENGKLADRAYIELPVDMESKTVLLVLGGYLHVLDEVYTQTGPRTLRVNFNKLALPERYFDSLGQIDLSSLPLTHDADNPTHLSVEELYSDKVLTAYLTLSQSFIVAVNATDFYVRRQAVTNSELPGRYEVPAGTERLPLMGAWGKVYDYVIQPDWGVNLLACCTNARMNYQFRSTKWKSFSTIDASLNTYRPWQWAIAHFLEMGRFG